MSKRAGGSVVKGEDKGARGNPAWDDALYEQVRAAVMAGEDEVVLYGQMPKEGPFRALRRVLDECPEVFWLSGNATLADDGGRRVLRLARLYPEKDVARMRGELGRALESAVGYAERGEGEAGRVELAYEWLVTRVRYRSSSLHWEDQTAYAALCQREAVCAGISRAAVLVLRKMGLRAGVVVGGVDMRPIENHAWTRVWLDGQPLHLDVTQGVGLYGRMGVVGHPTYLVPEAQMRALRHMEMTGAVVAEPADAQTGGVTPPVEECPSAKALQAALYAESRGLRTPGGVPMARTLRMRPGVYDTQGEFEAAVRRYLGRGRERMGFSSHAAYPGQTLVLWG